MHKVICCAILALLMGATIARNQTWRSEIALLEDGARKSPTEPRVHLNLGVQYQKAGRLNEALTMYAQTVRIAQKYPDNPLTVAFNLGAVATTNAAAIYVDAGQLAQAHDVLLKMPFKRNMEWYNQAAVVELRLGRPEEALAVLKAGESQFKDSAMLLYNEAETYRVMGRCDGALRAYKAADQADRTLGVIPKECK